MSLSFRDLVFGTQQVPKEEPQDETAEPLGTPSSSAAAAAAASDKPGKNGSTKNLSNKRKRNESPATKRNKKQRMFLADDDDDREGGDDDDHENAAALVAHRPPEQTPSTATKAATISSTPPAANIERVKRIATQRLEALYRSAERSRRQPPPPPPAEQLFAAADRTKQEDTPDRDASSHKDQDTKQPEESVSSGNPQLPEDAPMIHPMVIQNPHIPPAQLPHYRPPPPTKRSRRRRRRQRYSDDRSSSSSDDDDDGSESRQPTAEQRRVQEERRRRLALRKLEWEDIRKRWRTRKLDLRHEIDVGEAIGAAVARNAVPMPDDPPPAREGLQHHDEQPSPSVSDPFADAGEHKSSIESHEDGIAVKKEEEEPDAHEDFFNRLLQTSQEMKEAEEEPAEQVAENLGPLKDNLDFWEIGSAHPRHIQSLLYKPEAIPKRRSRRWSTRQLDRCNQDKYPGLRTLTYLGPSAPGDADDRDDPNSLMPRTASSRPRLQHKRQILRVVARYMFGCSSRGTEKEFLVRTNRMLRVLWNPSLLAASSYSIVDSQARSCGMRLVKFLGHNVEDTTAAMDVLEITRDLRMLATRRQFMDSTASVKLLPRNETHMKASSNHVAVPGTVPPAPQLPLISVGVEFGPTDKFNFVWRRERVPEETIQISLSTLFARWITSGEGDGQRAELEHQMSTMMEHVVRLNDDRLRRLLNFNQNPINELPILRLYQSMMKFCSLIASNGGRPFASFAGPTSLGVGRDTNLKTAALQLFHFLEERIKLQGLNAFPRIHLVFAILRISTGLPEEAVGIMARALGGKSLSTPFTMIREMLEYLENEDLLLEGRNSDGQGIEVERLEYLFFQASESVIKCIEADPIEPDYHAWYIAIKAGSFLLCSGNRIGSGARLFPSAKKKESTDDIFDDMMWAQKSKQQSHEVRPKLNKFDEVRLETAKAFELLLQLTKFQDSARCHSSVSSFLEWGQAIALLLGDSLQKQSHFTGIRKMHEAYCYHWAIREQSDITREYLRRAEGSHHVLAVLADSLEKSPESIVSWRCLVRALGALQAQGEQEKRDTASAAVNTSKMNETCNDVRSPAGMEECNNFDSHSESLSGNEKESKWYQDRKTWWLEDFLYVSIPNIIAGIRNHPDRYMRDSRPLDLKGDLCALRSQAVAYLERNTALEKKGGFSGVNGDRSFPKYDFVDWLQTCIGRATTETSEIPLAQREARYDHSLPVPVIETLEETSDVNYENLGRPFKCLEKVSARLEAKCYRLLIRCHLNTSSDATVAKAVKYFLCMVWDVKKSHLNTNHECWHALGWLYSMGVNILEGLPSARVPTKEEIIYPDEMRRVVKEHVAQFGPRNWHWVHNRNKAIFKGQHKHKAQGCYKFLLKKGLITEEGY